MLSRLKGLHPRDRISRARIYGKGLGVLGAIVGMWGNGEGARSQIVPDATLGTIVSPAVPCLLAACNQITGGTPSGNTLFHSFTQFSISPNTSATFINDNATIQNIISRVTGSLPSNIEGFIQAEGASPAFNLFLINPNGIIFGRDAQLELQGSFIATTAESIKFANGYTFGIHDAPPPPTLAINVPIGLQFGTNPGEIKVETNLSSTLPEKTIALVGSGIEMRGGRIATEEGRIELGSVGPNSLVTISEVITGFALAYNDVKEYRDIYISQGAGGDADAGQLQVRGRQIYLESGAALAAVPTFTRPGGTVEVYGSESVKILGDFNPLTGIYAGNQGNDVDAGSINIETPLLEIRDGALINNPTAGFGQAGDITLNVDRVVMSGGASISASTESLGNGGNIIINARTVDLYESSISAEASSSGKAGNIKLDTDNLLMSNGARVLALSSGLGAAGNIEIVDTNIVYLDFGSSLQVEARGSGNAGNINIDANIVWLENGANLSATNQTTAGGQIRLHDVQLLNLSNSSEISVSTVDGQGGSIEIEADWINLNRNSRILSGASGVGNSGNIDLTAGWVTLARNSQVAANHTGTGQAGNVEILAGWLYLNRGSEVTVSHEGLGNAGNLIATAYDIDLYNGSQLSSAHTGVGNAGGIGLFADRVNLIDGSQVTVSHWGLGAAGNIVAIADSIKLEDYSQIASTTLWAQGGNITLRDWQTLSLDNNSRISAATLDGQGGTINLSGSGDLSVNNNSSILASALGRGTAGNLNINTAGKLSIENDSEAAVRNTGTGNAGNLSARTGEIYLYQRGRITASTAAGNGGNIDLRSDRDITLRFNSEISAEAGGTGNGGNITLNTGGFIIGVLNENSDIVANAFAGNGGSITANTLGPLTFRQFKKRRTSESDFIASSEIGIDGTVTINAREQPPVERLPDDFLEAPLAEACDPVAEDGSRLAVIGGGLPPEPVYEELSSDGIWEDLRRDVEPLVEAKGWKINHRGNVVLVAEISQPTRVACTFQSGS